MIRSPSLHFRAAAAMSYRPFATRINYSAHNNSSSNGAEENNQQQQFVNGEVNQRFRPNNHGQHFYTPAPPPRQQFPYYQNNQFYPPRQPLNNQEYYRPRGGFDYSQQFRPPQQYRPRLTKPLDYRKWEYAKPEPPSHCERFSILSYNILADYLATTHRGQLYYHIPRQFLDWQWRKRSIAFELGLWSADILCFQEVDKFQELEEVLKPRGYTGIWKMRTGDKLDGCAIFWRTSRFKLLYEESIEFSKYGLRDNVAQICVLESSGCISNSHGSASTTSPRPRNKIIVCNIHVLFNPKRGEIKLGQVRELLHRADVVAKLWDEAPVILCGDFNSTPKSPLYNFIEEQKLDLSELPRHSVSGQTSSHNAPQTQSNHPGVKHLRGPTGDSLATSRNETADIGSPQIAENAGHTNSMMKRLPEVSFAGRNEDTDELSLHTYKEKELVLPNIKKDRSLCNSEVPGEITTDFPSSCSASNISTSNHTSEDPNLGNIPEVTVGGSEEVEHILEVTECGSEEVTSISSQVAGKWKESSPGSLPLVSSENLVLGGHGECRSLDEDYRLQDGSSNALDFHEVQIAPGELDSSFEELLDNGILDDTPVVNVEDNGSDRSMYNPSAWTPEEMRTATGNADCKVVEHHIKLKSTYAEVEDNSGTRDSSGEPLVTSYHRRFQGTVDYIWRSEGLQTVRVLAPIPKSAMTWTAGFPTKKWGSDHIALVSELAFVKDCSAQHVGVK